MHVCHFYTYGPLNIFRSYYGWYSAAFKVYFAMVTFKIFNNLYNTGPGQSEQMVALYVCEYMN
jgi:hypothetical protein